MDFSPRTYPIVRGRSALDVTVSNRDQLLDLRVELELVRQFGAWARPELLAVLEAEAARSRSGCCGRFRSWFRKLAGQGDRMAEDRKAR